MLTLILILLVSFSIIIPYLRINGRIFQVIVNEMHSLSLVAIAFLITITLTGIVI